MITAKEAKEIVEEARLKEEKRQEALVEPCLRKIMEDVGTASAKGESFLVLYQEQYPELKERHTRVLVFKELAELGYKVCYGYSTYSVEW